jgi:hypothetical protein
MRKDRFSKLAAVTPFSLEYGAKAIPYVRQRITNQ